MRKRGAASLRGVALSPLLAWLPPALRSLSPPLWPPALHTSTLPPYRHSTCTLVRRPPPGLCPRCPPPAHPLLPISAGACQPVDPAQCHLFQEAYSGPSAGATPPSPRFPYRLLWPLQ